MKKTLLLAVMTLLAVVAFAQTGTKDDPLVAHPGTNTCAHDASAEGHDCWWKFTTGRDGVFLVTPSSQDFFAYGYDATQTQVTGAELPDYGKAFLIKGGEDFFIRINGAGQVGFEADYFMQSGTGLDENNPVYLYDGDRAFLGDPAAMSMTTAYASYTATSNGVLVLNTAGYVSYCSVNGGAETSFSRDAERGGYTYKFKVTNGETYKIAIRNYNPILLNVEMTNPPKGSIDNPIEIKEGVNPVMGMVGTYYYTFSSPGNYGGFAKMTSDNDLTDGQVKVYKSLSDIGYDIVYKKSDVGSFNVEWETPVYSTPALYYIVIENKTQSITGYSFNFEWTRYTEGSDLDNPHMITEFPYNATTETEFNPVYYAIDVPAGDVWNVTARATGSIVDPGTKVKIYDPENKYSRYDEGNSSATYDLLGGENGYRYLITWDSKEAAGIPFEVTKKEVPEGDIIGKPIKAVVGENTIAAKGTGTKFYTYTATRNGKLAVTVSREGMNVTFPKGTGKYDGEYQCIKNGNSSYIPGQEGTLYYIKVSGLEDGDSFTLTEGDYASGEDRTTAIEVIDGVYNVENAPLSNYWLKYTVTKDCMLKIEGTMDASGASAGFAKNDDFWTTDMTVQVLENGAFVKKFITEMPAKKDDVFYVNFSLPATANGKAFNFTERDFTLGESAETAFQINAGKFLLPMATQQRPMWAKVILNEGEFHLTTVNRYEGTWYTSKENALNDNGERLDMTRDMKENTFNTDYTITTPGVYYIKFTNTTDVDLPFEASGSAITDEVIPYPHRQMYGFYLRNNAVEGYGLYSMYMDDLQNAEPVYRYDRPDSQLGAFCGAVVDDYWYGVNYIYSMSGPPIPGGFVKINIKNGEYHYIGEWAGADEDGLRFQDMTYDYTTNTMYAIGFNAGESAIYTFDLETAKPTRVIDLGIMKLGKKQPMTLGTLACDLEGNFYGMQAGDGTLYQVDITTGLLTPVMETTFTQMPGNQSMEFDRTTGLLYWSSCTYGKDEGQDTWLVVFDLKNNKIYCEENSKMGQLASCEGLYIPFVAAGSKAAAAPENLTVKAGAQGAKTAKLSWTTPTMTFDGRNFLGQLDKLTITRNGEVINEYEGVKPGIDMTFTDNDIEADGSYKYAVYATTEVGEGAWATAYEYVGIDYPNAISNLVTKTEPGCAAIRLTWNAPEGAAHNGYYDPASLRYRVKRYVRGSSSNTVVAEDLTSPEFVDESMKRLMSYWYSVTAYNEMGESERVSGDYTIAGPSVTPPVMEMLTDVAEFQNTWTTKDGNDDLYSWFNRSGMDAYTFGSAIIALEYIISPTMTPPSIDHAADEWIITPPINFEADKQYTISFQTRNLTTESLEVHTGNTNDPESMTKFADLTLEETPTTPDTGVIDLVSNKVTLPQLDGVNCVGIRLTTPITELQDPGNPYSREPAYFQITNFVISEVDPGAGVDAATVAGEDIDIAFGENGISINGEFDKAVLYDVSGRMLRTVTNGTVSADGLNGKIGMLVVTKGKTTKVFKVKL